MLFVETPVFTKLVTSMMDDEHYKALQEALIYRPAMGAVIPGTRGLRKVRWRLGGQGKRSGVRIIYYWLAQDEQIYMLYIYTKRNQEDLTKEQLNVLAKLVEKW